MTWDSGHRFTGLLVFVIDLLILVVLVVRHFLAVLPISDLRPLVYLEMVRFESVNLVVLVSPWCCHEV